MTDKPEQRTSEKTPPPPGGRTFTFKRTFTFGAPPPPESLGVPSVPEDTRTFKWEWRGADRNPTADEAPPPGDLLPPDEKPATYYEALSGRRDPMREFFITARRTIRIGVWLIAIAIPVGLIALTVATGQSFETIVFVAIGGAIVGLMFATTFPKTPFD